jgi:probable F420-dependent oxidoreductase
MASYLTGMREAPYDGHPSELPPIVLAALGPRMLELSAAETSGAHPFLAPVEHTARAREILGPAPLLAPELGVILTSDAAAARDTARSFMERFLAWPNYRRHLERLGYGEADLAGGGSDGLIDAVFAWGDEAAIRKRVDEHLAAGADHVAVQPIPVGSGDWMDDTRRLAPALLG